MQKNTVGKSITGLRESLHLNREQFAEKVGCSTSHIINIEKGRAPTSERFILTLIKKLSLPENYFAETVQPTIVPDKMDIQIGINIRKLRLKWDMTQGELAEKVGFSSASAVSAVETAKRPISKTKMVEFAKFFQVDFTELLRTSSHKPRRTEANDKLIKNFSTLVHAKKKAAVYDLIIRLLSEAMGDIEKSKEGRCL